jgi:hypothetical protein
LSHGDTPGFRHAAGDTGQALLNRDETASSGNIHFSVFVELRHIADANNRVLNFAVQIDMAAADAEFLRAADIMDEHELLPELRKRIFEIDNSLAMYQLLEGLFHPGDQSDSRRGWRAALDSLRKQLGRPIAVLAVTEPKYHDILASEFRKKAGEALPDDEVLRLSGFNALWGPQQFLDHLAEHRGECAYLLYVRSSDPIQKLRRPEEFIEHPLLGDDDLRRIIKANSVTLNIDNPEWAVSDPRRINDHKCYLPAIGTAFRIQNPVFTPRFEQHLQAKRPYVKFSGARLSSEFAPGNRLAGIGSGGRGARPPNAPLQTGTGMLRMLRTYQKGFDRSRHT